MHWQNRDLDMRYVRNSKYMNLNMPTKLNALIQQQAY